MAQYTLKLSFDLRQITQSLAYEFVQSGKDNYPLLTEGPLAGTFNFQKGDQIFVEVIATSAASSGTPKNVLEDMAVKNCAFISIPARMTEDLSLFDPDSACTIIEGNSPQTPQQWGPIAKEFLPDDNVQLSTRSLKPLSIMTKNGQWKISGYLSVSLTPNGAPKYSQLYFFDPEGSSGNGGGF